MVSAVSFRKRYCGVIVLFLLFCLFIFYSLIDDQMQTSYLPNYGSVVGWEFNRSRNASDYIMPDAVTSIIQGKNICSNKSPPQIMLIVCSKLENFDLRNAIRNTWAYFPPHKKFNVTVAFLMGVSANAEINKQVKEESDRFEDIIVENFVDTYNNLTLKTLMLLKWVKSNCDSASYVMKADDDIYINIENLVYFVNHYPKKNLSNALMGEVACGSVPVRDFDSKWFMPRYMYAGKVYPNYLSGYGYFMSTSVALKLYEEAFNIPLVHMEDVFFTGLCAYRAGVVPSQPYLFRPKQSKGIECTLDDKDRILFRHEISYEGMFLIHHFLKRCNDSVPKSVFDWFTSGPSVEVDASKSEKFCNEWRAG